MASRRVNEMKASVMMAQLSKYGSEDEGLLQYMEGAPSRNRVEYLSTVVCYYLAQKFEGIKFDSISKIIAQLDNLKENTGTRFVNIVCRLAYLQLNNKRITEQEFAGEMTRIGVTDWEQDLSINGIVEAIWMRAPGSDAMIAPKFSKKGGIGETGVCELDGIEAPGIGKRGGSDFDDFDETGAPRINRKQATKVGIYVGAPMVDSKGGVVGPLGVGETSLRYRFTDPQVQYFLAAIFLYHQQLVVASDFFITSLLSMNKSCWCVLEFYCGLVELDGSDDAKIALPHILKCLLKSVDGTKLIHNNSIVNLVLGCLFEAQNTNLCQMIHQDHLPIGTFCVPVVTVERNIDIFTYYVANSAGSSWTLYCRDNEFLEKFKTMTRKSYKKIVLTNKTANFITLGDVILSCKGTDDVNNIMFSRSLSSHVVLDSPYPHPASESSPLVTSGVIPHDPKGIYGYMTVAAYESRHQVLHEKNYDMLLDILKNRFQELCQSMYVEGQYRKRDHLWFSVSRDLRHNLYQSVQISPLVPLHWVKVKQPNGSPELEEQIRQQAQRSNQQAVSDIAELVMLNSHQPILIEFNYPHIDQPVTIALDNHSESTDQGVIGCDCFMDKYTATEPVLARGVRQFDIKVDSCVPRELPLPKKRDQPINKEEPIAESGPARQEPRAPHVLGATVASPSSHFTPTWHDPGTVIPVDQIKKWALKGFDHPGFCFYTTRDLSDYSLGMVYPLPDTVAGARILREGGNGLVLEVSIKGKSYAVKKTAFRWREILIMPRLQHSNILRVVAMLVGPPMPDYPRRRYIYHFYPKMKGDLGRLVGSYEKYCFRTLSERYRDEPLLLDSVLANIQHIARSLLLGLNYLHTLEPRVIIHRDVKPSNVLVNMLCACPNPLVCVCRAKPEIVLSDFDASLELSEGGSSRARLQPDAHRHYPSSPDVYHVSPVGTIGFKSPEGCLHCVGNHLDVMPLITTKLDVFSFGLLMMVLLLNIDGPRHLQQMGTMILSMNQSTTGPGQQLTDKQKEVLRRHRVYQYRAVEPFIGSAELNRVLPLQRVYSEFSPKHESLCEFMEHCLEIDPSRRYSAAKLLNHRFLW